MALSPEDVIKKSFSATHLRRGYDETQVDDFLDEVVVELRRLIAENDSLRSDLEDCRAGQGYAGDQTDSIRPAVIGQRDHLDFGAAPVDPDQHGALHNLFSACPKLDGNRKRGRKRSILA